MPASAVILSSRRAILLVSLDRHEKFLLDFLPERDAIEVETRITKFDQLSIDLEKIQGQLEDLAITEEEIAHNAALRDDFEPRLIRAHSQLKAKRVHVPRSISSTPNAGPSPLVGIKLPTIALPEYDGDYMQWLTYRDTFEGLIHDNPELPPIQKFHYLRASLKGEAAKVIESITISAANYEIAWKILTERYSNEYLLKKRHLQALFGMATMKRESASTLHHLVDEFERHKKTLNHLGENTDAWSSVLEHLLCTKLPTTTLRDWEEFASTNENPSYEGLVQFLQRRMRVLETLMVNNTDAPSSGNHTHFTHKQSNLTRLACPRFMTMGPEERYRQVMSNKLCLNCLRDNHRARDCSSQYKCRHCHSAHHTLLHNAHNAHNAQGALPTANTMPAARNAPVSHPQNKDDHATNTQRHHVAAHASQQTYDHVFLQTAVVHVADSHGTLHPVRALLDSASQPDLMSTRLAQRLALKLDTVNVTLIGAGHSSTPVRKSVRAKISSRTGQYQLNADFLIVDNLIGDLPAHDVRTAEWQIPPNFMLADPQFNKSAPLDLILGARHYHAFFQSGAQYKISHNLPVLIESVFGWIVTGSASACNNNTETSNASSVVCMSTLEESLERFWKVEELQIRDGYSPEERYCEKLYQDTTQRDDTGRYIVRLPKQPDFEEKLGLSKLSALRRFTMLERRLERDSHIKAAYHEFMHEYLELGHMSLIQAPADDESAYYLPHHPVFKASSTTTKTGVVFDGSAKTSSGYSLNEALCVGPAVQDDLLDIILRFRTYKVAVVGDIAKMYRQILLHPDDRKYARICFRFDAHSPIQYYELNTVTYGLSPSSFLATRTLQQLANDEGTTYPVAASALKSNFYVDDFIGGADSIESARRLRVELNELLSRGGFELRKWTSNRLEVLTGLTADQIGTQSALQFIPDETVKTLGVSWEPEHDVLSFESAIDTDTASPTKRSILSNIARMFDPLGLISPIVVRAKIMMQELWLQKAGWDDLVPDSICKKWENIQQDWPLISGFKIDRYALLPGSKLQLHTFCDASEAAYGACIYVRCESEQGEVRTTLLSSKSRVAPLKRVTLPRLELCAAVLGAHLYDRVKKAMGLHAAEVFFWSDSTVTLKWISASPNTWATFVGNRVSEVQHYTHPRQWRHVPGSTNPADLVSRGMSAADFLQSKLWSCGPEWLALPASNWPNCNPEPAEDTNLEIRQLHAIVAHRCILHSLHT
ncbi:uncharacterized protein LOC125769473 [Anopheles funestus]|uniref:uncharacterized protein LOC125769473 n=1 Tax=Anopheles funestus TaxID=62324 RepID=UPI0020C6299A|nr:uncharacterized protein LOC125769473 [Anopheles funestus]